MMPLPWHADLALATLVWFSLAATAKQVKMSFKMSSQHFDVVRVRVLQSSEQLKPLPTLANSFRFSINISIKATTTATTATSALFACDLRFIYATFSTRRNMQHFPNC